MSDYQRITMREFAGVTGDAIYNRLAEREDKIERGELVSAAEYESVRHHAEVAERALRKYIRKVSCSRCPYAMSCDIFPPTPKNDYIECFDEVLRLEEEE